MNRQDFREIAAIRLREARVLLKSGNHDGAYYLCGYVVECGLKACICKGSKKYDFPPNRKFIELCYSHNLLDLVKAARLDLELESEIKTDAFFRRFWTTAKDWTEQSRYEKHTEQAAKDLLTAVNHKRHGVLRLLKRHW